MAFKTYFTGKSGAKLWLNVLLMLLLIVAVPVVTFYLLDAFTHHGEKIEVPSLLGKPIAEAEWMLKERDLVGVVVDSAYDKKVAPGAVLDQSPKAGYEVKGGRVIYLTVNLKGAPMAQLPDVGNGTLREAVALLESLGFKLTPHEVVEGIDKDRVIGVKQGRSEVYAGQMVPRDRALTIIIGGGTIDSTLIEEEEETEVDIDEEDDGKDFNIEL